MARIIVEITDNHVPDEFFILARDNDVFYKDGVTGELVQILDLSELKCPKGEGWQHDPNETIAIPEPAPGKVCPSCGTRHRPGECKEE